jgi:hypothetical protein
MGNSEAPSEFKQGLAADSADTLAPITKPHDVTDPKDLKSQNSNPGQPPSSQS